MKIKKRLAWVLFLAMMVQIGWKSYAFVSAASMWDTSFEKNLIQEDESKLICEDQKANSDRKTDADSCEGSGQESDEQAGSGSYEVSESGSYDQSDLYTYDQSDLSGDEFRAEEGDPIGDWSLEFSESAEDLSGAGDNLIFQDPVPDETMMDLSDLAQSLVLGDPEDQRSADFSPDDSEDLFSDGEITENEISEFEEELPEDTLLALAPALMATGELAGQALMSEAPVLYASAGYKISQSKMVWVDDSMGRWTSTGYRMIHYTDSDGVQRTSPLYCMNASRSFAGVQGIVDGSGAAKDVQAYNVQFLKNVNVQKVLYFGYGGPGDITGSYDPTCSHINWGSAATKYSFTHYALSYLYSGDLGTLTKDRATESGLFRFIDECKKRDLPSFNDLTFYVRNNKSDAATATYTNSTNIKTKFTLERKPDAAVANLTGFTDGYQISNVITIHGCKQNYVTIKVPADKTVWQLLYWNSKAERSELGLARAHIATPGSKQRLYGGAYFRIVAARNRKNPLVIDTTMGLRPTEFIVVPGNENINYPAYGAGVPQQDFGAYIYTEAPAMMTIEGEMQPFGTVNLIKKDRISGAMISNASFDLYSAEKIYSGLTLKYDARKKVDTLTTAKGKGSFTFLYPGKYYLVETAVPDNYLLDKTQIPVVLPKNKCSAPGVNPVPVEITVLNTPNLKVSVSLHKVDEEGKKPLPGAVFAVDEWDGKKYVRLDDLAMKYDTAKETYNSSRDLVWTPLNAGKFRIREVEAPPGYEGAFSREFVIGQDYPNYARTLDLGTVTNRKTESGQLFVAKLDSTTGLTLEGAEFSLYRKNAKEEYEFLEVLQWDKDNRIYKSQEFRIPTGSDWYLLKETKAPEGYLGDYEEEIQITEEESHYNVYKEVLNDPMEEPEGILKIHKLDSKTGEKLLDAEFELQVWNEAEQTFEEYCMLPYDEREQCYMVSGLPLNQENLGRYFVKETRNPRGYIGEFEEVIQFDPDLHEVQTLERNVTNEPPLAKGEITVIKEIRAEDVNLANGYPIFHFVVTGCDIRGEKHSYEDFIEIIPTADGLLESAEGILSSAVVFEGIPEGDYTVYEKPVSRYYLANLTSPCANTSIFAGGNIGYGVHPKDSFYATVSLRSDSGDQGMKSTMTFFDEKKRWDRFSHNALVKNTVILK